MWAEGGWRVALPARDLEEEHLDEARRLPAAKRGVVLEPVSRRGAPVRCLCKGYVGDAGSVQLAARAVEDRQWHNASHDD